MKVLLGYATALTAIFFWSINILIASSFAHSLRPLEISAGRWCVASLILVVLAWKDIKLHWKILVQHKLLILCLALTGVVFTNTLVYYAGRTTTAIDIGLLDITGPIFLVIFTRIFLKTTIFPKQILGLMIAFVGVVFIILDGNFKNITQFQFVPGNFIMLFNTLSFATYSLLQHKRPPEISQTALLACTAVAGACILLPLMLITTPMAKLSSFDGQDWGLVIYLGVFNSVIAYLAWNNALTTLGNVRTSIIYYLLPIFSGIGAYFALGEKLYWYDMVGGLCVIGGIALVSLGAQKEPKLSSASAGVSTIKK